MFTIRKKKKFEMAHKLASSYSVECQQIHGHSYIAEIFISAEKVNEDGMVIDFKLLNEVVNPIINQFDHKLVIFNGDLAEALVTEKMVELPFNPTAELMAEWFAVKIKEGLELLTEVEMVELTVRLHETDTGWAQYTIKGNEK